MLTCYFCVRICMERKLMWNTCSYNFVWDVIQNANSKITKLYNPIYSHMKKSLILID